MLQSLKFNPNIRAKREILCGNYAFECFLMILQLLLLLLFIIVYYEMKRRTLKRADGTKNCLMVVIFTKSLFFVAFAPEKSWADCCQSLFPDYKPHKSAKPSVKQKAL